MARIVSSSYPISFLLFITFNFALKTRYRWPFSPHNPTASRFSLLSHLLPEPVYPSQRRWTDHRPQRAVQTETKGGRSSEHHRTNKESSLSLPRTSIAAVLFRTASQEFSSPPHAAIPFIEKRDPRRVDEPGSLGGGLCQIRIHLADQSVPSPLLLRGGERASSKMGEMMG